MEDIECDVLVIGAGPGGSSAARYAAANGMKTLLIEKRQEIGSPVRCGEGIARKWLNELGIEPDPRWISHEVDGARLVSPGGHELIMDERIAGNECGYVVDRDVFDKDLAFRAARAGAQVMVKTTATSLIMEDGVVKGAVCETHGERFTVRAKITVAADGFESKVARWAGIDTNLAKEDVNICFQYLLAGIDVDPKWNHFYVGQKVAPGGYVWVFPKGPDSANVGIGINLKGIMGEPPGAAKRYLDAFIAADPGLAKGFPVEQNAGAISCNMPLEQTVADGIMVVGDAARHIDPLTGGGVANACRAGMHSGIVAAKAVKEGNVTADFLMEYDRLWRDSFEESLLRDYLAKEKALQLSDETLDKVVDAIAEVNPTLVTTYNILKAVETKYPELVEELRHLL